MMEGMRREWLSRIAYSLIGVLICLTVQWLVGAAIGCDVTTVACDKYHSVLKTT